MHLVKEVAPNEAVHAKDEQEDEQNLQEERHREDKGLEQPRQTLKLLDDEQDAECPP